MSDIIPIAMRQFVRHRARQLCEYCQTSEWLSGFEGELDHIIPRALHGATTAENLCLACRTCNGYKSSKTEAIDPFTNNLEPLFHPRHQEWLDHFDWDNTGTRIIGRTPSGRATIDALHMNNELIVAARALWVAFGNHPPKNS